MARIGQCDGKPGPWGGQVYGFHYLTDNASICHFGCLLTDLSMDLKWAGVAQIPDFSTPTPFALVSQDPGSLDNLMKRCRFSSPTNGPCGFDYYGWTQQHPDKSNVALDWTTGEFDDPFFNLPTYLLFDQFSFGGHSDETTLETAVCKGPPYKSPAPTPVIVGVRSQCNPTGKFPSHYVLVTGETVDPSTGTKRFQIADPAGPGPGNLPAVCGNRLPVVTGEFLDGPPYDNHFLIIGFVTDPQIDVSRLNVNLGDGADFLVVDASGAKTGLDPGSESVIQQIPNSSYVSGSIDDDETGAAGPNFHSVQIFQPAGGNYTISVRGLALGEYGLTITPFARDGSTQPPLLISGIAAPSSSSSFTVQYSSTPGGVSTVLRVASFQSTLADINNGLGLGLIDNEGIANALSSKIEAAMSAASRGQSDTAQHILSAFKNQASVQQGKQVAGLAAQILEEDADSLIHQLP